MNYDIAQLVIQNTIIALVELLGVLARYDKADTEMPILKDEIKRHADNLLRVIE